MTRESVTMASRLAKRVHNSNGTSWAACILMLLVNEVCKKFGMNIENGKLNAFFWNIQLLNRHFIVNENIILN